MNGTGSVVVVVGGLFTLVNTLLLIIINQLWKEIRSLRTWRHDTANTMTAVEVRLREIERALGIPPFGNRRLPE